MRPAILLLAFLALAALLAAQPLEAAGGSQRFIVSVDNVGQFSFRDSGVFNTPAGDAAPGPLLPGGSYSWGFHAAEGDRLSFATMLVQSNDWFFAPDELGIPLFQNGVPLDGDVTDYVKLWDAGTEGDQPPGSGPDQAPRQAGPGSGPADPNRNVRQVLSGALPPVNRLLQASLAYLGDGAFRLTLTNLSANSSLPGPLAPGVGVVHTAPAPLFINGQPDFGLGLEAIAEDGNPAALASVLAARTGIASPLAPVAWTVAAAPGALFTPGTAASAGLESLAEDGSPALLIANLAATNKGAAAVGRGAAEPGPIFPGDGNYSFEVTAAPGDHLSLAFMYVQSNDWFFGVDDLPLFNSSGQPRSGSITPYVALFDAGTEVDQAPGFGPHQAPRQAGPNRGATQGGTITPVTAPGFTHAGTFVHVTITPVE
jgi:hypothetical protein